MRCPHCESGLTDSGQPTDRPHQHRRCGTVGDRDRLQCVDQLRQLVFPADEHGLHGQSSDRDRPRGRCRDRDDTGLHDIPNDVSADVVAHGLRVRHHSSLADKPRTSVPLVTNSSSRALREHLILGVSVCPYWGAGQVA